MIKRRKELERKIKELEFSLVVAESICSFQECIIALMEKIAEREPEKENDAHERITEAGDTMNRKTQHANLEAARNDAKAFESKAYKSDCELIELARREIISVVNKQCEHIERELGEYNRYKTMFMLVRDRINQIMDEKKVRDYWDD